MDKWYAILNTYDDKPSYRLHRNGQLVASVSGNSLGWVVIPRTANRKRSRKRHKSADLAVKSMFGTAASQAIENAYAGFAFEGRKEVFAVVPKKQRGEASRARQGQEIK